jgi:hypothetical protein
MLNFEEILNLSEISENYLKDTAQDFKSELEIIYAIRKYTLVWLEEDEQ